MKYGKKGRFNLSNELLIDMVNTNPDNPLLNYHCAWRFDIFGEEHKTVPYYERALELGLTGDNQEDALLGLGSTYRTIGQYKKSASTFLKGMELFPDNMAMQVFYSMTLYNLKDYQKAMEVLLQTIVETSKDKYNFI